MCKDQRVTDEYLTTGGKLSSFEADKCLSWAVEKEYKDVVELLIVKGINVNVKDQYGDLTPLHKAVEGGNKEIIELLIAKDADVNIKNKHDHTPLHKAVEEKIKRW